MTFWCSLPILKVIPPGHGHRGLHASVHRKAQLLALLFNAVLRVLKYPFAVCHRGSLQEPVTVLRHGRASIWCSRVPLKVSVSLFRHGTGAAARPMKPSAAQNRFTLFIRIRGPEASGVHGRTTYLREASCAFRPSGRTSRPAGNRKSGANSSQLFGHHLCAAVRPLLRPTGFSTSLLPVTARGST